jgi:hypothetical protein
MKRAAVGDVVTISPYDWRSDDALPDDPMRPIRYLRTLTTRGNGGGTVYWVRDIRRVVPRRRLPHGTRARYSIRAVKLGNYADIEMRERDRVGTLKWNERAAKRGRAP